jgi:hypothetical protein
LSFRTANGRLVETKRRSQSDIDATQYMLEMGEARQLYWTWRTLPDGKERLAWFKSMLGRAEKLYGPGSADRIRKHMGVLKAEFEQG